MEIKKKKSYLVKGAVSPVFIGEQIGKHSSKTDIGAHSIFLGQVRNDEIDEKKIAAIDYSCYEEMAENKISKIRETAFEKYDLKCLHIYHSIGKVKAGEISLFVFVSSKHRKDAVPACSELVEQIKANVPIWGKEIFEDETFTWKENT